MSTDDDLSTAFGRPARNLSTLMAPNPRRARREQADTQAGDTRGRDAHPELPPEDTRDSEGSPDAATTGPAALSGHPPAAATAPGGSGATSADSPQAAPPDPPPGWPGEPATPAQRGAASRTRRQTGARSKTASTRGGPISLDPDTSYQVGVYVHPHARSAAIGRRKTEKITNAEIVFDAIDAVQHRLEGLIRERRVKARPESSLFPGRVRRGRKAGGGVTTLEGDARRVLWQFRASGAELEVIDRLMERSGAESRSELVAVALETTLLT